MIQTNRRSFNIGISNFGFLNGGGDFHERTDRNHYDEGKSVNLGGK